jgi:hypothetical protein
VIVNPLVVNVERAEADNYNVNVRLASGFAFPCESAMREVDFNLPTKQLRPKNTDLLALRN